MSRVARGLVILTCLVLMGSAADAKAWFADLRPLDVNPDWTWTDWYRPGIGQFVRFPAFSTPANALGAPQAGEVYDPLNDYVTGRHVTLGDRDPVNNKGWLVVGFSTPIYNDPRNPYGLDFIVFSNAYFKTAGSESTPLYADPTHRWQELAMVEISQDLETWYLIRPNILPSELIPAPQPGAGTGDSTTMLRGYAEYTPTIHLPTAGHTDPFSNVTRTSEELYTIPDRTSLPGGFNSVRFDYVSGGGDALDIADAVLQSSPGVPALDTFGNEIPANIDWFKYVRLTDVRGGDSFPGLGEISAEIDAVSATRTALSIGEAKQLDEGEYAFVTEAIVTAVLPNAFFVESPNRTAAMKVIYDTSIAVDGKLVQAGDKMSVTGHLSKTDGVFRLPDPMWTCTSIGNELPAPLGMPIRALSGDMAYGMRIKTYGAVVNRGTGYCVIDDGGRAARVVWSGSHGAPAINSHISVVGVCDREEGYDASIVVVDPSADIDAH